MVTSWPPSSIALMSRPLLAISRLASAARASPAVSSACSRAREAAVSAVSAPAKNAAPIRLKTDDERGEGEGHARSLTARVGQIEGAGVTPPRQATLQLLAEGEAHEVTRHDVLQPFEVFGARRLQRRSSACPRRRRVVPRRGERDRAGSRRRSRRQLVLEVLAKLLQVFAGVRRWRSRACARRRVRS